MTQTALILGATGGFGASVAQALAKRGVSIRALHRNPSQAATSLANIEWRRGDVMNADDVIAAADGVDFIVHGVNPPAYRNWRGLALPMLASTIAAARASGARILFPGTVYNFGPDAGDVIDEHAPQNPQTRKGKIRVEMEQALARASEEGVRTIVIRAGDYFGPDKVNNSWFTTMAKPGQPVRQVIYPGERAIGHAWAYLPDLAEAVAELAMREALLPAFDVYHFEGHYFEHGVDFAEIIAHVSGCTAKIGSLPWAAIYAVAPFNETLRETLEMRYLWQRPLKLDGAKLRATLGKEPHTPVAQAVEQTLTALGSMPVAAPKRTNSAENRSVRLA